MAVRDSSVYHDGFLAIRERQYLFAHLWLHVPRLPHAFLEVSLFLPGHRLHWISVCMCLQL